MAAKALTVFDPNVGDRMIGGDRGVWQNEGAPDGDTYAGLAKKGDLLVDTENAVLYQNTGTLESPTWTPSSAGPGDDVVITGGTIDGAVIGGDTPAAGSFTDVDADDVVVDDLHLASGTKTVAAVGGAATLDKQAGVVTSESLTTAAGAAYTLTLANATIAAADQVMASLSNGTNTQGELSLERVTPGAGSVVIVVRNRHASDALNGTIKIAFVVFKN